MIRCTVAGLQLLGGTVGGVRRGGLSDYMVVARWEENEASAGRILLFGNVQRPGLPLFSSPPKVSTVERGAQLRQYALLPECQFNADAHRSRAGGG